MFLASLWGLETFVCAPLIFSCFLCIGGRCPFPPVHIRHTIILRVTYISYLWCSEDLKSAEQLEHSSGGLCCVMEREMRSPAGRWSLRSIGLVSISIDVSAFFCLFKGVVLEKGEKKRKASHVVAFLCTQNKYLCIVLAVPYTAVSRAAPNTGCGDGDAEVLVGWRLFSCLLALVFWVLYRGVLLTVLPCTVRAVPLRFRTSVLDRDRSDRDLIVYGGVILPSVLALSCMHVFLSWGSCFCSCREKTHHARCLCCSGGEGVPCSPPACMVFGHWHWLLFENVRAPPCRIF